MQSVALPRSAQIQTVLKLLNDQFSHPNPFYYHRHLLVTPIENGVISIEVEYFDAQDTIEAHVLAFLHVIGVIHDSVREMLFKLVGDIPNSIELARLIEERLGDRAERLPMRMLCRSGYLMTSVAGQTRNHLALTLALSRRERGPNNEHETRRIVSWRNGAQGSARGR